MVTGGEAIAKSLIEEGVDTVFGLPGTHVLGLYAALHDYRDRIKHVLGRFEPSMGFMADGYARASGRVGVVIVTAGPGATGLVTPLAQASVEGVPIVALAGLTPIRTAGRGYYHEFRDVNAQLNIFKSFTKYAVRVEDPREIPRYWRGPSGWLGRVGLAQSMWSCLGTLLRVRLSGLAMLGRSPRGLSPTQA